MNMTLPLNRITAYVPTVSVTVRKPNIFDLSSTAAGSVSTNRNMVEQLKITVLQNVRQYTVLKITQAL